jgi:hypothetical protein
VKRALWILKGKLTARAGWITEACSGIYFGHLGDLPAMHYSYHSTGRKYVAFASGGHFRHQAEKDTPLGNVAGRKGVGGFSIDPSKLDWLEADSFGATDLVFKIDEAASDDMPFLVSAFIFPNGEAAAFANEAHSAGAYKDECVTLPLAEFSHLTCVTFLQYMVRESDLVAVTAI